VALTWASSTNSGTVPIPVATLEGGGPRTKSYIECMTASSVLTSDGSATRRDLAAAGGKRDASPLRGRGVAWLQAFSPNPKAAKHIRLRNGAERSTAVLAS